MVASWQKRLLPMWFVIIALAVTLINDVVIVLMVEMPFLMDALDVLRVLWPFLMGTAMLLKAQSLAREEYVAVYGTPPPQVTLWTTIRTMVTPSRPTE
jgi:hypothetical protein